MRNLIVDYIPFELSPQQIQESLKENNGKLVVKGVLQRADAKNQNGRVYPLSILQREAKNYNDGFIKEHNATRDESGIFDVSHMGQLFIEGNEDLTKNLQKIFPIDLKKLTK